MASDTGKAQGTGLPRRWGVGAVKLAVVGGLLSLIMVAPASASAVTPHLTVSASASTTASYRTLAAVSARVNRTVEGEIRAQTGGCATAKGERIGSRLNLASCLNRHRQQWIIHREGNRVQWRLRHTDNCAGDRRARAVLKHCYDVSTWLSARVQVGHWVTLWRGHGKLRSNLIGRQLSFPNKLQVNPVYRLFRMPHRVF